MIEFLLDNWQFFAAVLLGLIELIILVITKKHPQILDNSFIFKCAEWIENAERVYKDGASKMEYVLCEASRYLGDRFNEKSVREIVEWILSLPEKKEK